MQSHFPGCAASFPLANEGMASSKHKLTQAEYKALAEFRYAIRRFLYFSENAARAAGVTPQHHQAMLVIKGFPRPDRITIGGLAERLQLRPHSAVGLTDRLVTEGYVRRMADKDDRRQVRLGLTSRGEAVLEKLSSAHHEQLRRMGPQINRLLTRLRGN
jgi:DNA-binding MarR family transcriptional regulator